MSDSIISVPANFGIHNLQRQEHGNITLILKKKEKLRANSMVLTLNSVVFEDLICNHGQSSIDMDDFNDVAVHRFIESLYIGQMRDFNQEHFRDFNKMSYVFEVHWLIANCCRYMRRKVAELTRTGYDEMFFVFEEIRFIYEKKKNDFTDLVIKRIQGLDSGENMFVLAYTRDYQHFTTKQLDLVIRLAGNNISLLLEIITFKLRTTLTLDDNSKYLLQNIKLPIGIEQDKKLYNDLFALLSDLDGLTKEDLKMIIKLQMASTEEFYSQEGTSSRTRIRQIPNLFHCFHQVLKKLEGIETVREMIERLGTSHGLTKNLYMLVRAIRTCLLTYLRTDNTTIKTADIIEQVERIKLQRGWSKIGADFLKKHRTLSEAQLRGNYPALAEFCQTVSETESLCSDIENLQIFTNMFTTLKEFLLTEQKYKFYFKHPAITGCSRPGNCGFLIKVTPTTEEMPEKFTIELCTEPSEYKCDIHFHDIVAAEKIHLNLESYVEETTDREIIEISYCGKPEWKDGELHNYKIQRYW